MPIISKTARDSELATMEPLSEMTTWESNDHVTDDVTWPQNVNIVTSNKFDAHYIENG